MFQPRPGVVDRGESERLEVLESVLGLGEEEPASANRPSFREAVARCSYDCATIRMFPCRSAS